MYARAIPRYKAAIPTLVAVTESQPVGSQTVGNFVQVPGYSIASFAGYVNFWGDGSLTAAGWNNRGGVDQSYDVLTGTYTLTPNHTTVEPCFEGEFTTAIPNVAEIRHFFVAADRLRVLHFMIRDTFDPSGNVTRQPVASGVMTRMGMFRTPRVPPKNPNVAHTTWR
jgi:hypothetical protein